MRAMTSRVTSGGEDPAEVARTELIRMDLIEGIFTEAPRHALRLAVSPSANAERETATVLRALRRSVPTRNVELLRSADTLAAVETGAARLALVSAPAFFSPGSINPATGAPPLRSGLEAVALVGTSYLHLFALDPEVTELADAEVIATGHRTAPSIIDAFGLSARLAPVIGEDARGLARGILKSGADAAILVQPLGKWCSPARPPCLRRASATRNRGASFRGIRSARPDSDGRQ